MPDKWSHLSGTATTRVLTGAPADGSDSPTPASLNWDQRDDIYGSSAGPSPASFLPSLESSIAPQCPEITTPTLSSASKVLDPLAPPPHPLFHQNRSAYTSPANGSASCPRAFAQVSPSLQTLCSRPSEPCPDAGSCAEPVLIPYPPPDLVNRPSHSCSSNTH